MKPLNKHLYLALLIALSCATAAQAQDDDGVVVDMGVLEELESYQPPPMFEDSVEVIPLDEPVNFPVHMNTNHNSFNPSFDPSPVPSPVPQPIQKAYIPLTPPLPKKRPTTMHAPVSFIQKIRSSENLEPLEPVSIEISEPVPEPQGLPGPSPDAMDITADPLTQVLNEPTAQEIFNSLEEIENAKDLTAKVVELPEPVGSDLSLLVRAQRAAELGDDIQIISIAFDAGQAEMSPESQEIVGTKALAILKEDPNIKIQIQAFSQASDEGQSSARRIALARAINIRAFLIENNIDPKRIDLRALGSQTSVNPVDRVDLLFLDKAEML